MNKKFLLTSVIALSFAAPAFATPEVAGYPDNDATRPATLWINRVYEGAAVSNNFPSEFVFDSETFVGTLYANALFDSAVYYLETGKYLPQSSVDLATCVAGYFCPGTYNGDSAVYYSTSINQGAEACPDTYANSDSGASSPTQCYRVCSGVDVAHASSVNGNDYYGSPADTCEPASCEFGWHVLAADSSPVISSSQLINAIGSQHGDRFYTYSGGGIWLEHDPYATVGGVTSETQTGLTNYDKFSWYNARDGFWAVDYANSGILNGLSRHSSVENTSQAGVTLEALGEDSGANCYCTVTGYKPSNTNVWQKLTGPWIYAGNGQDVDCAYRCAKYMQENENEHPLGGSTFRNAMLYSISSSTPAQCVANTINIRWTTTTEAYVSENNAGSTVFGGDVRTPAAIDQTQVPAGKVFKGWQFSSTPLSNQTYH